MKEIQVNRDGTLEVSYDPKSIEAIELVLAEGYEITPDIEMVSKYGDNLVLVYHCKGDNDFEDYFAEKYSPEGDVITKMYSKKFWKHPNIQLPKGSRLANQFGVGYCKNDEKEILDRYDVYFFHPNQHEVERHFKSFIDCEDLAHFREIPGLYGVTYTSSLKVLNLKRYMYPFDPFCKNPDYI